MSTFGSHGRRGGQGEAQLLGDPQPELVERYLSESLMNGEEKYKRRLHRVTESYQRHDQDTGSSEVQVARLSERIQTLSAHLQKFRKDVHGKRAIHVMLSQRTKLLKYMKRKDPEKYYTTIAKLGLKDRPFSEPKYPTKK